MSTSPIQRSTRTDLPTNDKFESDRRTDWQKDSLAAARLLWARWGGVWTKLWLLSLVGVVMAAWIHRLFSADDSLASNAIVAVMAVTHSPLLLWSGKPRGSMHFCCAVQSHRVGCCWSLLWLGMRRLRSRC